jgi:hypothetical protein
MECHRSMDGFDLLAVSSADGSQRIWIMLWPKSPSFYKQMPEGNFEIGGVLAVCNSDGSQCIPGAPRDYALAAHKLHADDTPVPVVPSGKAFVRHGMSEVGHDLWKVVGEVQAMHWGRL